MALWRIRATVDDRPGFLSVLTASLALRGVNILAVQVHTTEAGAVDDFLVDAPAALTADDLLEAVRRGRGRDCWVARSEAQGLVDQPTRALGLASWLVRDPDALGEALRALLNADSVTWRPTPDTDHPTGDGEPMRLPDPAGGMFEVVRAAPDFTPAEYARAQALVDLAGAALARAVDRVTLVLPDGAELLVRPAVPDDLPAVRGLHERCSPRTLHARYGTVHAPGGDRLRRLVAPVSGLTLLASPADPDGAAEDRVVALGTLVAEGDLAELTLLVEDGWQRRGVGGALVRRLVRHARRAGHAALIAHTTVDNVPMLRILDRFDPPGVLDRDDGRLTLTVPLAAGAGRAADQPVVQPPLRLAAGPRTSTGATPAAVEA